MNEKIKQMAHQAIEQGQQGWQSLQNKIEEVSTTIGGLASRFSLIGLFHKSEEQRQVIHYFLIPACANRPNDSLYVMQTFPAGADPQQEWKKHRIFHVGGESAMTRMKEMVYQDIVASKIPRDIPLSAAELTLQELGQTIDDSGNKISGGMMIVGSLLTLVNPVAGMAVMAGAVVPDLGNWVSQKVIGGISGKLADKRLKKAQKAAQHASKREVKESTDEVYVNPLLRRMMEITTKNDATAGLFPMPHDFNDAAWYGMTLEAIYQNLPASPKKIKNPQEIDHFLHEVEKLRHAWKSTNSSTL